MYSLNRDHVLADVVLGATGARGAFLDRLSDAVQSLSPQPLHVSIFGSFARNEGGPGSDIDVLFILPSGSLVDAGWEAQVRDLGERVLAWTGNRMEHIAYTEDELLDVVKNKAAIVESWRVEALTLHGPDVTALLHPEA
jgi:predicted nucleotidyltransferase